MNTLEKAIFPTIVLLLINCAALADDRKAELDAARSLIKEIKPAVRISTTTRQKLMYTLAAKLRSFGSLVETSENLKKDARGKRGGE